jgi:hypothetical protein
MRPKATSKLGGEARLRASRRQDASARSSAYLVYICSKHMSSKLAHIHPKTPEHVCVCVCELSTYPRLARHSQRGWECVVRHYDREQDDRERHDARCLFGQDCRLFPRCSVVRSQRLLVGRCSRGLVQASA